MVRKYKCTHCKNRFDNPPDFKGNGVNFDSYMCLIEYTKAKQIKATKKKEKLDKKENATAKRKLNDNDKSLQTRKAQTDFNKFIRTRDEGNNCISCGKPPKKKNAGHYKSRGAYPELRFDVFNCHLQCEHCNTHLSGNLSNYRVNLISKIGLDKVEWLEGPHEPKRYTIPQLKTIQKLFKQMTKALEDLSC